MCGLYTDLCSCYVPVVMGRLRTLGGTFAEPCLPGLGLRQLDRLFFSIFPAPPAAVQIANTAQHFRRAFGLKGNPLSTERFHVSIHGIGDYDGLPRSIVDKAIEAGAAVTATSFDVAFDRVKFFSSSNALVLCGGEGIDGLIMFHQKLGIAMREAGLCAGPNFTPHVTLLYNGDHLDEQPINPIRWTVREFVLVHSLIGSTKHVSCGRWQLCT
jgi:2'-5' RNA ligase